MENTGFDNKEILGTVEGKIRSIVATLKLRHRVSLHELGAG